MIDFQGARWLNPDLRDECAVFVPDRQERSGEIFLNFDFTGWWPEFILPDGRRKTPTPFIHVRVEWLPVDLADWRALANREWRINPAWVLRHEFITHFGRLADGRLGGYWCWPDTLQGHADYQAAQHFRSYDYDLRIGSRNGIRFICELDAWLESRAEPAVADPQPWRRERTGAPDLRIATEMSLESITVLVEAHTENPVGTARRRLRERLRLTEPWEANLEWMKRRDPKSDEYMPVVNSRSTVRFLPPEMD